jgi:uridine kinase
MALRLTMNEAVSRLAALSGRALVGVDGLPCAGKSTLVDMVLARREAEVIYLDDFVRPEADWPSHDRPAYPFDYIRYDEFIAVVQSVADGVPAQFSPFDWTTGRISEALRTIEGAGLVIVEGVSALAPALSPLYELSIFVDSDRTSVLAAASARGLGPWAREWETLFLPSADLYMVTRPQDRAGWIVGGRGAAEG